MMGHWQGISTIADEVIARVTEQVSSGGWVADRSTEDILREFLYQESLRQRRYGASLTERRLYQRIALRFPHATATIQRELVETIVRHYVDSLRQDLASVTARVIHPQIPKNFQAVFAKLYPIASLDSRWVGGNGEAVVIEGDIDQVRTLMGKGSVFFALSNTCHGDTLLFSAALDRLGLSPVAHAANSEYLENPLIRYVFGYQPAWKVDRRYSDPLYYEVVHEFTSVLAEMGFPQFGFPSPRRSADGTIPKSFRREVLLPIVTSFRNSLRFNAVRPVYVIPVTLNYPFVLEAETLANIWVDGKRARPKTDEFYNPARWTSYVRNIFRMRAQLRVRFGQALDPLGNKVDANGESIGSPNRLVDPADYFRVGGEYFHDTVRDSEYIGCLSLGILQGLRTNTVVYPIHVVAYALFHKLWDPEKNSDWRRFLHQLELEGPSLDEVDLRNAVALVLDQLSKLAVDGKIQLDPTVSSLLEGRVFDDGCRALQEAHSVQIVSRKRRRVELHHPRLLMYYRNKLDGFGLFGHPMLMEDE